jgi:transposase
VFSQATRVTDGFQVQRLAVEALQEIRIKHRWEALDAENDAIEQATVTQTEYVAEVLSNGDTVKQLLARSRYALYKKPNAWTGNQKERANLVFERFPDLKKAYDLAQELSNIFTNTTEKIYGLTRLANRTADAVA